MRPSSWRIRGIPLETRQRGSSAAATGRPRSCALPGRVRIAWENDATLKVDTEAGTQTRRFQFARTQQTAAPSWQGTSVASWQFAGGRRGGSSGGGSLRVVTQNLRAGYLRKNGVPYSADAQVTEFYTVVTDAASGDTWLFVTTMVEDPQYLSVPRYVTSSHFKKTDGATWNPTACEAQ